MCKEPIHVIKGLVHTLEIMNIRLLALHVLSNKTQGLPSPSLPSLYPALNEIVKAGKIEVI